MVTSKFFSSLPSSVRSNSGTVGLLSKVVWNTTALLGSASAFVHTIDGMWIAMFL